MVSCDVCGSDRDVAPIKAYVIKLIEEDENEDDQAIKRHDIDLCDQCVEKIIPMIKSMIKHKDGFSINNFLKPVEGKSI